MLVRVWRKGNPCTLLLEMQIGAVTVEKSIDVSQRTKNRATPKRSNSTLGRLSGKNNNNKKPKTLIQKDTCTLRFIVALLVNISP